MFNILSYATTWSDEDSENNKDGEDIFNELVALVSHSTKTPPQSQSQIFSHVPTLGPQDGLPSGEAYDPVSTLGQLDGEPNDAESIDDEEISYEELTNHTNSCMTHGCKPYA